MQVVMHLYRKHPEGAMDGKELAEAPSYYQRTSTTLLCVNINVGFYKISLHFANFM